MTETEVKACGRERIGGAGSLRSCPLPAGHSGQHVFWTSTPRRGGDHRVVVIDADGVTLLDFFTADPPDASRVRGALALRLHAARPAGGAS